MNKKPIRIYLGGMIRPATIIDGRCQGVFEYDLTWRRNLAEIAEETNWFLTVDPLDGFWNHDGTTRWDADSAEIVRQCLAKLKSCHVMIANLSTCGEPMNRSIGTVIEIWQAAQHYTIPVVVVTDDPYYENNCWIRFAATYVTHTINEALTYIQGSLIW